MPGAGSRKATAYVAAVAAKDGTAIGAPYPGALVEPVFGDPKNVRYKPLDFGYIGSVDSSDYLCLSRTDSNVHSFADVLKNELVIGGDAKGSNLFYIGNVLRNVLGAKFKIVNGYKGSHDIVMAMERGEVHGMCGYGWSAVISQAGFLLQQKKVHVLIQFAKKGDPEPTKLGVPMVWDFVRTPEQRELLELVAAPQVFGRPYFLPAGAPKDRLMALRRAFDKVMKDPGFLADAKKQKLSVSPATGEEVEANVKQVFTASPAVLAKVRAAMND
jgi:tripartite-type tricarboxylate transporter receptor subunit TctC